MANQPHYIRKYEEARHPLPLPIPGNLEFRFVLCKFSRNIQGLTNPQFAFWAVASLEADSKRVTGRRDAEAFNRDLKLLPTENYILKMKDKDKILKASKMKLQHNKKCKGLIAHIRYLEAKFIPESVFSKWPHVCLQVLLKSDPVNPQNCRWRVWFKLTNDICVDRQHRLSAAFLNRTGKFVNRRAWF